MTKSTGKDETIVTAGIISNVRVLKSKQRRFLRASRRSKICPASIDMIVFPEAYKRIGEKVKLEVPVLVKAGVRIEEGTNPKITAAEIMPLEDAKVPLPRAIRIRIPLETSARPRSTTCTPCFVSAKARPECCSTWNAQGDFMVVMEAEGYNVLPDRNFIARVEQLCGRGSVRVIS